MIIAMNSFDENAVNEVIMKCVINRGFEKTFTEVLFTFLQKVGIMWQTGAIDLTTEHFITSLFRQRLISAADSLPSMVSIQGKRVLMFLPEGEYHELGLLFYYYVIKKRGHRVLYLGQATPFDSMISTCAKWSPDIVITGLKTELNTSDPEEYLRKISAVPGIQKIYAGGVLADHADKLNLKNIKALRTETDLDFLL
jgi:methanogenic corrinoid protein MtbC1